MIRFNDTGTNSNNMTNTEKKTTVRVALRLGPGGHETHIKTHVSFTITFTQMHTPVARRPKDKYNPQDKCPSLQHDARQSRTTRSA
jgi:hypothetical protein